MRNQIIRFVRILLELKKTENNDKDKNKNIHLLQKKNQTSNLDINKFPIKIFEICTNIVQKKF